MDYLTPTSPEEKEQQAQSKTKKILIISSIIGDIIIFAVLGYIFLNRQPAAETTNHTETVQESE